MKSFLKIIVLSFTLVACSKDDQESETSCIENFYKYPRTVLLTDSFNNNQNNWNINLEPGFMCNTSLYCEAKIDSGMFLKTGGKNCGGCEASASWNILLHNSDFLAAEVKFNDFFISMGYGFAGTDWASSRFVFGFNGLELSFGHDLRSISEFKMNAGGYVIHFLLDLKNQRTYAFSDKPIPFEELGSSSNIVGKDLRGLTEIFNSSNSMALFECKDGFVDLQGPEMSQMSVEYITLYEPIFPCN